MSEATVLQPSDGLLSGFPTGAATICRPPLTEVARPQVTLQPGETLVLYHPHSQCPRRVFPTVDLHTPCQHMTWRDIETAKASYAPLPTRADFEQAEIFIIINCSNKLIDDQLRFQCQNGLKLGMKTSHDMHKLLALSIEEDLTDDSKVGSFTPPQ